MRERAKWKKEKTQKGGARMPMLQGVLSVSQYNSESTRLWDSTVLPIVSFSVDP